MTQTQYTNQKPKMSKQQKPIDTLICASWTIPVTPRGEVFEDFAIAVHQGRIVDLLPESEALQRYQPDSHYTLENHALLPGLINAHGHASMSLFRGLADDLPLMEWLNDHIWPAEARWVNEAFVTDGSKLAIAEMIRSGTTCFSDMYFFPEVAARVAQECGIRAQLVCPVLDFPTVWASKPEEYLEKSLKLAIEYAEHPLINVGLGPHAPYTVSDKPLINIRDIASEYDIPVQIHLHETQQEVDEALSKDQQRPLSRLAGLGLLSDDIHLQCVHMTALNEEDIAQLKGSAASVVHCPESNLKLASGFCPVQTLLDSGITVALGTDGAASNNDLDMIGEMRTAALLGKAVAQDASALSAPTALEMATLGGARALGIDDQCGTLEIGKSADIIAVDMARLNTLPSYDLISDIVYSLSSSQVSYNWIAGELKLEKGQLTELDEHALRENAISWSEKIKANK